MEPTNTGPSLVRLGLGAYPMSRKVITLDFVVSTLLAVALAIVLSIGAVHLIDNYLGPIDQAEANYSSAARD
jgi:hypothetical protein